VNLTPGFKIFPQMSFSKIFILNMNRFLLILAVTVTLNTYAQTKDGIINVAAVHRIEGVLASDSMMGREAGKPGSEKAARFIASEFKKAGLVTWKKSASYLQPFNLVESKLSEVKGVINDEELDPKKIVVLTTKKELEVDEKSGYEYKQIPAGVNMMQEAYNIITEEKKAVVFVDESYAANFSRLNRFLRPNFESDASTVFILSNITSPQKFKVKAKHNIDAVPMANVVGVLPGKTKPDEYVIFSAHYDHLGIGKPVNGDSIHNGANDDAAGTTAVIMLANYFKKLNDNARTLVFAAFTAEEIGGFGSQYFSKQFDPKQVVAMFNIEMIGTESKWGKNSAYITGYEKTDMGKILQGNLKGTSFTFYPDPYPEQDLFYRSDNATLARLGVPAHTISTSKMDSEKYYHTVDDEIETLDMQNMAAIIKAIAESAKTIIAAKQTPTRVNTKDLR
jgi:hypothetical protein